jgi:hypothetical protein
MVVRPSARAKLPVAAPPATPAAPRSIPRPAGRADAPRGAVEVRGRAGRPARGSSRGGIGRVPDAPGWGSRGRLTGYLTAGVLGISSALPAAYGPVSHAVVGRTDGRMESMVSTVVGGKTPATRLSFLSRTRGFTRAARVTPSDRSTRAEARQGPLGQM